MMSSRTTHHYSHNQSHNSSSQFVVSDSSSLRHRDRDRDRVGERNHNGNTKNTNNSNTTTISSSSNSRGGGWPLRTLILSMMREREVWIYQCIASVLWSTVIATALPILVIIMLAIIITSVKSSSSSSLESSSSSSSSSSMPILVASLMAMLCISASSLLMLPLCVLNCSLLSAVYPSRFSDLLSVTGKRGVFVYCGGSLMTAGWGAANMMIYRALRKAVLTLCAVQQQHTPTILDGVKENEEENEDNMKRLWLIYGAALGLLLYTMRRLYDNDVAIFPPIQRTRLTRLKQAILSEILTSIKMALAAASATVIVAFIIASQYGHDINLILVNHLVTIDGATSLLVAGYTTSYVYGFSCRIIHIVYTTRVRFVVVSLLQAGTQRKPKRDDIEPLMVALSAPQHTFIRSLATVELYTLTCSAGQESKTWRTRYIFADESGMTWSQIAVRCLDPIESVVIELKSSGLVDQRLFVHSVLGKGLFRTAGGGATTGPQQQQHYSAAGKSRHLGVDNQNVGSIEELKNKARRVLQSKHQLCIWSCEILAIICTSSLEEDTYGVLQVCVYRCSLLYSIHSIQMTMMMLVMVESIIELLLLLLMYLSFLLRLLVSVLLVRHTAFPTDCRNHLGYFVVFI